MNIPECREFVIKHRPICCGKQVDSLGYNVTNSYQYFVCRCCDNKLSISYWPLTSERIRELKLNSLIQ